MAHIVRTGTVSPTDEAPSLPDEEQETPKHHPVVVVHNDPQDELLKAVERSHHYGSRAFLPKREAANEENIKTGRTVVRRTKPNVYGVVSNVVYRFGSIKAVQHVYVKFTGKHTALPYHLEDLDIVYLN